MDRDALLVDCDWLEGLGILCGLGIVLIIVIWHCCFLFDCIGMHSLAFRFVFTRTFLTHLVPSQIPLPPSLPSPRPLLQRTKRLREIIILLYFFQARVFFKTFLNQSIVLWRGRSVDFILLGIGMIIITEYTLRLGCYAVIESLFLCGDAVEWQWFWSRLLQIMTGVVVIGVCVVVVVGLIWGCLFVTLTTGISQTLFSYTFNC